MTERINHAATAVAKDQEAMTRRRFWASWRWQRSAQVHATLALVEQQKIANLIALQRHEVEWDVNLSGSRLYLNDGSEDLKPEVAEALGL